MKNRLTRKSEAQRKRKIRVRRKVKTVSDRPRLSVFKSNRHISVQVIDDISGLTLASCSTLQTKGSTKSKETAKGIGAKIAELAKAKNVTSVVFDRGSYKFHGVIAELANAAREAGLQF